MPECRPNALPPARVLVVDDDLSTRVMVSEVLRPAGFAVEAADGGRQGLEKVESFRPDLVLLDVLMPDLDGFATLEAMRQGAFGARCPVVIVTGLQAADAIDRAYGLGATDFITKPINWPLLPHRVKYLIRANRALEVLHRGHERMEQELKVARRAGDDKTQGGVILGLADRLRELTRIVESMHQDSGGERGDGTATSQTTSERRSISLDDPSEETIHGSDASDQP